MTSMRGAADRSHSREVLLRLRKDHPMVLVSNFYGNINVVLREFQLDDLFDSVVESAVVGIRKPDSRIFTLGVEAMQAVMPGSALSPPISQWWATASTRTYSPPARPVAAPFGSRARDGPTKPTTRQCPTR